jgi:hypothetical protein
MHGNFGYGSQSRNELHIKYSKAANTDTDADTDADTETRIQHQQNTQTTYARLVRGLSHPWRRKNAGHTLSATSYRQTFIPSRVTLA